MLVPDTGRVGLSQHAMALTTWRLAVIACLGCATIAIAYWPFSDYPAAYPYEGFYYRPSASDIAGWNAHELAIAVALLERRDTMVRDRRSNEDLQVVFDSAVSQSIQQGLTKAIASVLSAMPRTEGMRIAVFASQQTNIRLAQGPSGITTLYNFWYFLPPATDGRTCLVLSYPDDWQTVLQSNDRAVWERWAELAVGPCAWYRSFGSPGPGVYRWLRRANYLFARGIDHGQSRPLLGQRRRSMESNSVDLGPDQSAELVPSEIRACAHGDLTVCRDRLRHQLSMQAPFDTNVAVASGWRRHGSEFEWLLADLHHTIGDDRFRAFWRSTASVDSAFLAATGVDIEEWTHRWLLGRLAKPSFGPTPTIRSLALAMMCLGLLFGVATLLAARRHVA